MVNLAGPLALTVLTLMAEIGGVALALCHLGPDWSELGQQDHWGPRDLGLSRLNAGIGFPIGGLLSLAIASCAATVMLPEGIAVSRLSQVVAPVGVALGAAGLTVVLVGVLASTCGAALETALTCGYSIAQCAGWPWGKRLRPTQAPQFHALAAIPLLFVTQMGA